ncbi:hypothetical protein [uncultured Gammaproteobacteria bacterium]|nr:hypothetical protein [uncultured Gammaproteobacteria bacterium]
MVNIPFDRLIECCTYDVNLSLNASFIRIELALYSQIIS